MTKETLDIEFQETIDVLNQLNFDENTGKLSINIINNDLNLEGRTYKVSI